MQLARRVNAPFFLGSLLGTLSKKGRSFNSDTVGHTLSRSDHQTGPKMFQVFNCLAVDHDWHLVLLAAGVCLLASGVAVSLFQRAQATQGKARLRWLLLDAAAAGCGIWATHFIAMLAYDPGAVAGYDLPLTVISLLIAAVLTGAGLTIALQGSSRWMPAIGGSVIGIGIAAMHFTGMLALQIPGHITWSAYLILSALLLGCAFGGLALTVAVRSENLAHTVFSALLLAMATVSLHFTAMAAITFVPDPTVAADALSLSPTSLSLIIGACAAIILGMCLVAALSSRQWQSKLRQQKVLLDTALQNMSQGLCMFDAQGRVTLFNNRYAEMTGVSDFQIMGRSLLDLFRYQKSAGGFSEDPDEFFLRVMTDVEAGKSNTKIRETLSGRVIRVVEEPMQGGGWVATVEDITEWRKAQAQLSYMAHHDSLTGLPNRAKFREELDHALRHSRSNNHITVLCLDLDRFKEVNDSLGHPVGDELLKQVAKRLSACLRDCDTVCRLGGDEFAILQLGNEDQAFEASSLARRLIETVEGPYDIQGHQLTIGVSIGISLAPADGGGPDQIMKSADLALYRAKSDGRGTYRFFEAGMDARAQARRLLEIDLRAALKRGEFEVYYQPIHDLRTNSIICFEALVRWCHPLRGTIPPLDFIPLAEETGLIIPIGDWVLRRACMDAASWSQAVRVAVNLSPVQFKSRHLLSSVVSALADSGLAAGRLELEITESVLLQETEATLATLHKLRGFGVKISMDDFGTGYSSLSYLRSFPFDKIKIDRSFVSELATREDSAAIVRAVTGLGKSLGILTTAEGVETSEQLAVLRSEGCNEVQGYLFSPPRPAAEVEKMLSDGSLRIVA
jgi:diguanylate cyclase (GGDEF)-like protein/PAS domain S-box-containing protein